MRKFVWLVLIMFMVSCAGKGQVIDLHRTKSGLYKVNCKVNGIPMDFLLDTGCNDVTVSATEAMFLVKCGLLDIEDILDKVPYMTASGRYDTCTTFIIRKLEIDGIVLENVMGSVTNSETSPLLLGQSAIEKLGPIMIDFKNERIVILNKRENE